MYKPCTKTSKTSNYPYLLQKKTATAEATVTTTTANVTPTATPTSTPLLSSRNAASFKKTINKKTPKYHRLGNINKNYVKLKKDININNTRLVTILYH